MMSFRKALIVSLLLHLSAFAALLLNYHFKPTKVVQQPSGKPIKAKAVDAKKVEQLVETLRANERRRAQRIEAEKKAAEKARRKRIEEERRAEEARKKRQAEEKRAEKERQLRIAREKARKKKLEEEKRKKAEAERKRQLEEKRKREAAERKRKAEAERKRKEAERRRREEEARRQRELEQQLAAEAAELEAARQQAIPSEVDKYVTLIRNRVKRNWIEPEAKGYCVFKVRLAPGGLLLDVEVIEGDTFHCESGRRAIFKSEPLPVSADSDVFMQMKEIRLTLDNREQENNP